VKRVSATWQVDPLNLNPFPIRKSNGSEDIWSYFELADAPAQPLIAERADGMRGRLEAHSISSQHLGSEQRVWLYTPPHVEKNMPLVVLLDGWDYHTSIPTPTILDNLIAEGRIPPTAAVLIDTPRRLEVLDCSEAFATFLAEEVVLWAHEKGGSTLESAKTIVGGLSLGGVQAAFTALRFPHVFGGVMAQSGSFWRSKPGVWGNRWNDPDEGWLIQQFATTPKPMVTPRFYIEAGRHENPSDHKTMTLLRASRYMRDVLRAKGYDVTYHEFEGAHRYVCWRGTLGEGIATLLQHQ
jgi:enterochelin esterase-like enzyme